MRIVLDLDGVICPVKDPDASYADLEPIPGSVERISELKAAGHYLIVVTARHMATCEANVGQVVKRVGRLTLDWMERYGVPYDEFHFGKPNAEVYVDDRALRFTGWPDLTDEALRTAAAPR